MAKASALASVRLLLGLREAFLLPPPTASAHVQRRMARNRGDVSEAAVAASVAETIDDIFERRVIGRAIALDADMKKALQRAVLGAMAVVDMPWGRGPVLNSFSFDIAARLAAFMLLVGRRAPAHVPPWVHGRDRFVRSVVSTTSTKSLRETCRARAAAGRGRVGQRTLDGILAGDPIRSEEVLHGVAEILKAHMPEESRRGLCARLRLHYAARAIVEALQRHRGAEATNAWLAEIVPDCRRFQALFMWLCARRLCGPKHRDNEFLKHVMVYGLESQAGFSPLRVGIFSGPEDEFLTRVRKDLDEHFDKSFEPPETAAPERSLLAEMGVTQGSLAVLLQFRIGEATASVPVDGDPVCAQLHRIPVEGTRDELVESSMRLDALQDQYPDEPRILARRAWVLGLLGEKQRAKTLAKLAAAKGDLMVKAALEARLF